MHSFKQNFAAVPSSQALAICQFQYWPRHDFGLRRFEFRRIFITTVAGLGTSLWSIKPAESRLASACFTAAHTGLDQGNFDTMPDTDTDFVGLSGSLKPRDRLSILFYRFPRWFDSHYLKLSGTIWLRWRFIDEQVKTGDGIPMTRLRPLTNLGGTQMKILHSTLSRICLDQAKDKGK